MSKQYDEPKSEGISYVKPRPGGDELEPRDYIYALELGFDADAQLMAIGGLLRRNRDTAQSLRDEIKKLEERTKHLRDVEQHEWAVADWVYEVLNSTYQEAAHSMSAVGMLAPLVETVFHQCFQSIGKRYFPPDNPPKTHDRWNSAHALQWDCHFVVTNNRIQKDIIKGIFQLSDAIGLTVRFPADLRKVLSALFAYRNNMFHHGFEWPVEERERFAMRIESEGWPTDWFSIAITNGKPWIFSLSDNFIRQCNKMVEEVLQAIGAFVRDELLPSNQKNHP